MPPTLCVIFNTRGVLSLFEFYFEKGKKPQKKIIYIYKTVTTSFTTTETNKALHSCFFFIRPLFFSRFGKMSSGLLEPRRCGVRYRLNSAKGGYNACVYFGFDRGFLYVPSVWDIIQKHIENNIYRAFCCVYNY